jgi:predicted NBD/HSP70 family sugar kinase
VIPLNRVRNHIQSLAANTPGAARQHNRRIILQALRRFGSLSRAELARATGLSSQAIANIVDGLIKDGLLREAGRRKSARGQPPIALEIADDGGYVLGIRMDAGSYNAIAVNLVGETIAKRSGKSTRQGDAVARITRLHQSLAEELSQSRCFGVGVVTPGPFDTSWPGVPAPGAVPELQSYSIVEKLSHNLGIDVFHGNDAYAAALGEKLHGACKDLHDFFYLYIGEGVGGGIVIGDQSYRGVGGNGGEVGHLIVDPGGRPCYCGNRGCLGQYLSLQSLQHIKAKAKNAEAAYLSWLSDAAAALRTAISSIENLLDPQSIVLGGSASLRVLEDLKRSAAPLAPSVRQDHADRVRISTLGEESAAYGASALPLLAVTSSGALT